LPPESIRSKVDLKRLGIFLIVVALLILVLTFGPLYLKRWLWDLGLSRPDYAGQNSYLDEPTDVAVAKSPIAATVGPVSRDFGLMIRKIGVNVPIVKNVSGQNAKEYFSKLKGGVAHQEGSPLPDKNGNMVIFGHSSFVPGVLLTQYSDVFLLLDKLQKDDEIEIWYSGQKYLYSVSEVKQVSKGSVEITKNTKDKRLTIFTCWPPGTDFKRLVVIAKPK